MTLIRIRTGLSVFTRSAFISRFVTLVTAMLFVSGLSAQTVIIKADTERIDPGPFVEIHRDVSKRLSIESILENPASGAWKRNKKSSLNFGFTEDVIWLRFRVRADSAGERLLVIPYTIQRVDMFHVRGARVVKTQKHALGAPASPHNHIVFRFSPGFDDLVYLRISSRTSLSVPLTLWDKDAFAASDRYEQLLFGCYFGILFIMAAYNLFVFFSVRQAAYLYYVLWIVALLGYQLKKFGYYRNLVSIETVWVDMLLLLILSASIPILSIQFSRRYLNLRETFRRTDNMALGLMALFVLLFVAAPFVRINLVLRGMALSLLLTTVFLIVIGIRSWMSGFRPARFFVTAWTVLLVTTFAYSLKLLGLLPNNIVINIGFLLGSVLEVMLLSLGLGDTINHIRREKEQAQHNLLETRTALLEATSRFVPEQFISILGKESILEVKLGDSVQKELAILFSDIRAFSNHSENMTPDDNFGFINSYLKRMEPAIRNNNGFIDKYIGDAIMALYPVGAREAVKSAIEMQKILTEHNQRRRDRSFEPIAIGIGIHSGEMMLGTVGGDMRMDTTVISDSVNLASRLEGLTKTFGSKIIISEDVAAKTGEGVYTTRELGKIRVKGKDKPVNILEVIDADEPALFDLKLSYKGDFEAAVEYFRLGDISEAHRLFKKLGDIPGADSAVRLYLERCEKRSA